MAKKQLNVNVNQSFLQTVVNMVVLKEIRIQKKSKEINLIQRFNI